MTGLLKDWEQFPKIGLVVEGKKKFFPLREAIPVFDSGLMRVDDTGELLEEDFSVRQMTHEENKAFQNLVDKYSARK